MVAAWNIIALMYNWLGNLEYNVAPSSLQITLIDCAKVLEFLLNSEPIFKAR